MRVSAAVTNAPGGEFLIEELDLDDPRADEILVRIVGAGLCHTDLVARDQMLPVPLPAVFGHEGSGIVERVGAAVTKLVRGDHVVLTFRSCGECPRCVDGEPSYCQQMGRLNYTGCRPDRSTALRRGNDAVSSNFFGQSSFATFVVAYERNVVKVDRDAPLALLGPLGCGVQTGAGAVLRALACPAGSSLLILGGGSVGLSALLAAHIAGCSTIIVSDPAPSRRELARELGATHVIDPATDDLVATVRTIVPSGADYALDTTGLQPVMNDALKCLRSRGTLGLLGVPPRIDVPTPGFAVGVMNSGHIIKGIIEGDSDPDVFIPQLVAYHKAGRFPFDKLIKTYIFAEINEAVRDQLAGKCTKPVLLMPNV